MVNFYVYRINKGKMTVEEVPVKWRDAVKEALGITEEPTESETTE